MPKKLMDCIEKVKAKGHDEQSAWGICVASLRDAGEIRYDDEKKEWVSTSEDIEPKLEFGTLMENYDIHLAEKEIAGMRLDEVTAKEKEEQYKKVKDNMVGILKELQTLLKPYKKKLSDSVKRSSGPMSGYDSTMTISPSTMLKIISGEWPKLVDKLFNENINQKGAGKFKEIKRNIFSPIIRQLSGLAKAVEWYGSTEMRKDKKLRSFAKSAKLRKLAAAVSQLPPKG